MFLLLSRYFKTKMRDVGGTVIMFAQAPIIGILLALVFGAWYWSERTLSIHTIYTTRREGFYWLAILFTFALGTSAGDLTAERLNLGYLTAVIVFAAAIGLVALAHFRFGVDAVLSFWAAYILTRPLGASIGDYLSQPRADGGLGLGTTVTSVIFLSAILLTVVYLTITRRDVIEVEVRAEHPRLPHPHLPHPHLPHVETVEPVLEAE